MGYDEFRTEYDAVMSACLGARLSMEDLAEQVDRLGGLVAGLPPADRDRAAADLSNLEEILALARQTPYTETPAFAEASRIFGLANAEGGTPADRIDRARRGIQEIRAIADRVPDQQEQFAIMKLTEPLAMLIGAQQLQPPGVR